uniref:Battenin n=1 Tax=Nothobranchius korthausae TaxID=1143690 RepID=A0A1A8FQ20_9TELE
MESSAEVPLQRSDTDGGCSKRRCWAGFWILGLCNNLGYVVMLSAALDILSKQETRNVTESASNSGAPAEDVQAGNHSNSSIYDCSPITTGAVLLADILPTLFIKLLAPFVIHKLPYGFRVLFCVIMALTSFLLVSFSSAVWISIFGVVFASLSAGLGELSFLSLSVFFSRKVLQGWGSGTGAAGLVGALIYSGLIQVGLSPQVTLLIMLLFPVAMLLSYFGLLVYPPSFPQWRQVETEYAPVDSEDRQWLMDESEDEQEVSTPEQRTTGPLTWKEKCCVIKGLWKFVWPLAVVYFAEYFINQGLMELLFFHNIVLSHADQYRWYQTLYQFGVLVSRSSLCCFQIRKLWGFSLLQCVNAVFLLFAVRFQFLPSIWLVFCIIFFEGLLGGAAYVNTFHFISKENEDRYREFAMATASVGDSLGIALAGIAAFPVHNYFCSL